MKAIRMIMGLCFLFLVINSVEVFAQGSVIVKTKSDFSINLSLVKTYGNFSYIPLDLPGEAHTNSHFIFKALDVFEKNSGFEILSFTIDQKQSGYWTSSNTFGIWVHHRPKK